MGGEKRMRRGGKQSPIAPLARGPALAKAGSVCNIMTTVIRHCYQSRSFQCQSGFVLLWLSIPDPSKKSL